MDRKPAQEELLVRQSGVKLAYIDFFNCGFLLAFFHVLYVSHSLNLLMLSSHLS